MLVDKFHTAEVVVTLVIKIFSIYKFYKILLERQTRATLGNFRIT